MGNNSHLLDSQYYLSFDTLWFPYFEPPRVEGTLHSCLQLVDCKTNGSALNL